MNDADLWPEECREEQEEEEEEEEEEDEEEEERAVARCADGSSPPPRRAQGGKRIRRKRRRSGSRKDRRGLSHQFRPLEAQRDNKTAVAAIDRNSFKIERIVFGMFSHQFPPSLLPLSLLILLIMTLPFLSPFTSHFLFIPLSFLSGL